MFSFSSLEIISLHYVQIQEKTVRVHILLAMKHTYTAENLRGRILFKLSDDDPNITFLQEQKQQ